MSNENPQINLQKFISMGIIIGCVKTSIWLSRGNYHGKIYFSFGMANANINYHIYLFIIIITILLHFK